jgi:sodium-dependent dicarboxylate transporter 2/3/5
LLSVDTSHQDHIDDERDAHSSDDSQPHEPVPVDAPPVDLGMSIFQDEYAKMGPILYEEIVIIVLFAILVVLWMTRQFWQLIPIFKPKYIDDGTVAILVSIFLFLIPSKNQAPTTTEKADSIMSWSAMTKFPWDIILIFGGGFALSNGFQASTLTQVHFSEK